MFNHLPWYTERKNDLSSRLNAAESMRAGALLNAPPRAVAQRDDDDSNSLSGSDAGSEEFDAELVEAGGDTTFPRLQLSIRPRARTALVFNDVLDSGMDDERTEHSGTPPSSGVKYAINCWIRARPEAPGMLGF